MRVRDVNRAAGVSKITRWTLANRGRGLRWDHIRYVYRPTKLFLKRLFTLKVFMVARCSQTQYKMAALIQSGLICHRLSPIVSSIDDFQKGFDAMRSGQSGKVIPELINMYRDPMIFIGFRYTAIVKALVSFTNLVRENLKVVKNCHRHQAFVYCAFTLILLANVTL